MIPSRRLAASALLALAAAGVVLGPAIAGAQYNPPWSPPSPPPPASAGERDPRPSGPVVGFRVGYGTGSGELSGDRDAGGARLFPTLDGLVRGKLPFWMDVGYRFSPFLRAGLYLEIAPVFERRSRCPRPATCGGTDLRAGVAVEVHPAPRSAVDPWLGLGLGAERLESFASGVKLRWAGLELPLVEGGLDVATSPRFAVGPYAAWSLGRFTRVSIVGGDRASIAAPASHAWLQAGLRGTWKL